MNCRLPVIAAVLLLLGSAAAMPARAADRPHAIGHADAVPDPADPGKIWTDVYDGSLSVFERAGKHIAASRTTPPSNGEALVEITRDRGATWRVARPVRLPRDAAKGVVDS